MSRLLSIDIETACGMGCTVSCEHALHPHANVITVMATYDGEEARVFRTVNELRQYVRPTDQLLGHNFKFDLKTLAAKGLDLFPQWRHDSLLLSSVITTKIDEAWLASYELTRKQLNAAGAGHRDAGKHSLKTLAPYFLGVEPFWETNDHNNDEYVAKDAKYTRDLFLKLYDATATSEEKAFYSNKMMPWATMLYEMEARGVMIDMPYMAEREKESAAILEETEKALELAWAAPFAAYKEKKEEELKQKYAIMRDASIAKGRDPDKAAARYAALYEKALPKLDTKLNLASPTQLSWLLRDYFGLDIEGYDGEDSTGKAVLNRLAGLGRPDIDLFLKYREHKKLLTAFFPSYREMQRNSRIHCSFNAHSTRTGRLSSSGPNLQQVPGHLHALFCAGPGRSLITKDQAALEPVLIAYYSEDPFLIDIIQSGADFHGHNTKIFFDLECDVADVKRLYPLERKLGKEVGLALMYGAGARRLQECAIKYGFKWSLKECSDKVAKFKAAYEGVYRFRDQLNKLLLNGAMPNLLGRPFSIPDPHDIHMKGLNTLIQSSGSDLVIDGAFRARARYKALGLDAHISLLVHDEIVGDADNAVAEQAANILEEEMTNTVLSTIMGRIPLRVEGKTAERWEK